jgi:hypothetical protein
VKTISAAVVFLISLSALTVPSSAVTVSFDGANGDTYIESGFSFEDARISGGNCLVDHCMSLNKNETSILSRVGGGLFSLNSFWLQILGKPATLTIKSFNGINLIEQIDLVYPNNNGGQIFNHLFDNVTSISFHDSGRGNVRIDDLNLSTPIVSTVPVPAALPLLATGIAGLGLLGRGRRKLKNSI